MQGHSALHVPKARWSEAEDALLRDAYMRVTAEFGEEPISWNRIAELVPARTAKQCRERWVFQLNPSVVSAEWTEAEDKIIFELVRMTVCVLGGLVSRHPPHSHPQPRPHYSCKRWGAGGPASPPTCRVARRSR